MTKQDLFNKVALHLTQQGSPARNRAGLCQYHVRRANGDTLKCAIGCLIPESKYSYLLEGAGVSEDSPKGRRIRAVAGLPVRHRGAVISLALALQRVHDCVEPTSWRQALMAVADAACLNHDIIN